MIDMTLEDRSHWIDVLGPTVKRLSTATGEPQQYAVILGSMAPGVIVPLHRHDDRETFYVLDGAIEGYANGRWNRLAVGDVLDIGSNEPHAWRNASDNPVKLLIVTTEKMASFFQEIGKPATALPQPPTPEEMMRLMETAERFGYALATPEENAAIGLTL